MNALIGSSDAIHSPLDVARGTYKDLSNVRKFGFVPDVGSGDPPVDVWEFGVSQPEYIWPAWGTAPIDSISSTNTGDTVPITVVGLDINGFQVEQTVTLTGQTRAALTTPLWRVYRMWNADTNMSTGQGTSLVGNVFCYEDTPLSSGQPSDDSKVRAVIVDGNNQTQMMIYTVPKGKVAYMTRGETGIQKGGNSDASATVQFRVRTFGGVLRVSKTVGLVSAGDSYFATERMPMQRIPELADIIATVTDVTGNTDISLFAEISMVIEDTPTT